MRVGEREKGSKGGREVGGGAGVGARCPEQGAASDRFDYLESPTDTDTDTDAEKH